MADPVVGSGGSTDLDGEGVHARVTEVQELVVAPLSDTVECGLVGPRGVPVHSDVHVSPVYPLYSFGRRESTGCKRKGGVFNDECEGVVGKRPRGAEGSCATGAVGGPFTGSVFMNDTCVSGIGDLANVSRGEEPNGAGGVGVRPSLPAQCSSGTASGSLLMDFGTGMLRYVAEDEVFGGMLDSSPSQGPVRGRKRQLAGSCDGRQLPGGGSGAPLVKRRRRGASTASMRTRRADNNGVGCSAARISNPANAGLPGCGPSSSIHEEAPLPSARACSPSELPFPVTASYSTNCHSDRPSASAVPEESERPRTFPRPGRNPRQINRAGPPNEYRRLRPCECVCRHCFARFWYEERLSTSTRASGPLYSKCCRGGKVRLFLPRNYPPYIQELFSDGHFMNNIRAYNQMFAMTSLGANVDDSINLGRGPYVFKVSGQIYHTIGRLCPENDDDPRFLQLYIYDTEHEVENRLGHFSTRGVTTLRRDIVEGLIRVLDEHNALVQLFRTARDKLREADVPEFKLRLYGVVGSAQHELPTADSIGAIVYEDGPESLSDFDIVLERHSGEPERVNKLHPCYMAFQLPLLFVYGEQGYHTGLRLIGDLDPGEDSDRRITMNMYYAYQIHDRVDRYVLLTRGGRLFQQYVVMAYCSMEQNRMDFIRQHQSDIRGEYLTGLYDAVARGDQDGSSVGSRIILPASFTGGPRYMYSHYLDALAICRVHGNPSFFITFTCNVRWPEIREYMEAFPNLTSADRPDVVDRVFERKIRELIRYIRDRRPFGRIVAVLYTVEFQKRGLPHCHILIWNHSTAKIVTTEDVDRCVSAELPNEADDPEGFRVVSEFMMHGPCGAAFPTAPCMRERGTCKKFFPKDYCNNTFVDDAGYVHYRRRDRRFMSTRGDMQLDNGYVVPYNRELCMVFYAHINVECCGWTMLIKYLFKYISKGTDRIIARITRADSALAQAANVGTGPGTSTARPPVVIDEIKNFMDCRYIGPHEACWRILGFDIHSREPAVQILSVHPENMQQVVFRSGQELQAVLDNPGARRTTLTEWLEFNRCYTVGRHLTYLQFPAEFVWSKKDKQWCPRRDTNRPSIGRLTYVHPSSGDLFYQRLLLCHQKGCTSFRHIRTVNDHTYATYRAAAEALGLLENDGEWFIALQEAAATASSKELRALFVQILVFCDVSTPMHIWNSFWKEMSDDIPRTLSSIHGIRFQVVDEDLLKGGVLFELEAALNQHNRSLREFELPMPPQNLLDILTNRSIMEERCYDRSELAQERDYLLPKLNLEQRRVFDVVMGAVTGGRQETLFVYGHGGTGKTFLWKAIITALRADGKIVLAVASSGIAALLLPSGRTAHSRFKLPLLLTDESVCSFKKTTQLAKLIKETDLIIWDEAPMSDRRCFEALDRTMRDIFDLPSTVFGGRSVMLGGDFRQTLPVKKKGTKSDIISSCISESYLWRYFKVFPLSQNMRTHSLSGSIEQQQEAAAFSEWLLQVGDGHVGEPDLDDPDNASWLKIPDQYCFSPDEDGKQDLIKFIYDPSTLSQPSAESLQDRAIVVIISVNRTELAAKASSGNQTKFAINRF